MNEKIETLLKLKKSLEKLEKGLIGAKTVSSEKSPREESSNEFKNDVNVGEYVNARKSKFKNLGEDITNSARHKAVAWKGLKQAEIDGNAEELTNLKTLLRHDPPQFKINDSGDNVIPALGAHFAMQKLPKAPDLSWLANKPDDVDILKEVEVDLGNGKKKRIARWGHVEDDPSRPVVKTWTAKELREKAREYYVDLYSHMKGIAEQSHSSSSFHDTISQLRKGLMSFIEKHSPNMTSYDMGLMSYLMGKQINKYHRDLVGKKSNTVTDHVNKFGEAYLSKVKADPELANEYESARSAILKGEKHSSPKIMDILHAGAHAILKGKSLSDAFKLEKKGKKVFDASEFYNQPLERNGPDHGFKNSEDHSKYLLTNSKMRGIQYGNSVTDSEREHHLNQTANAIKDLTQITGLPEEMGSFNGRLGLAFGARGKKRAAAHYEPDMRVINMTRHNGTGSLAHEWAHAFDDILSEVTHGKHGRHFASDRAASYMPIEEGEYKPIYETLRKLTTQLHKEIAPRMSMDWSNKNGKEQGISYDKLRNYWLSTKELFARAFERYAEHKLETNGRKNTYLVSGAGHWMWPNKEETAKIAPLFDELFSNFKNSSYLRKSLKLLEESLKKSSRHEAMGPKHIDKKAHIRADTQSNLFFKLEKFKSSVYEQLSKVELPPTRHGEKHPHLPYVASFLPGKKLAWFHNPEQAKKNDEIIAAKRNEYVSKFPKEYHGVINGFIDKVSKDFARHAIPSHDAARARHLKGLFLGSPEYDLKVHSPSSLTFTVSERHGKVNKPMVINFSSEGGNKAAMVKSWEDKVPGGLADTKKPSDFNPRAIKQGKKVELEHTYNPKIATEIAMDHLSEDPNYYKKLAVMEGNKLKKSKVSVMPVISSIAVVNGNKILMGKRTDDGLWTLPGGHLEPNETPDQAAIRELFEEAAIKANKLHKMGDEVIIGEDGIKRHIHAFLLIGKPVAHGRLDPDEEVKAWLWIDCSNGLPKNVKENLHSPKNVTLKLLGLL